MRALPVGQRACSGVARGPQKAAVAAEPNVHLEGLEPVPIKHHEAASEGQARARTPATPPVLVEPMPLREARVNVARDPMRVEARARRWVQEARRRAFS